MQSAHGTAVVFVTHDLGVVAQICDHVTLLFAGRVIEAGSDRAAAGQAERIPIRARSWTPARDTIGQTRACARFPKA